MIPGFDPYEVDPVFGPPATSGYTSPSDMRCDKCQVYWHSDSGPTCWVCGAGGRVNSHGLGVCVAYVDEPPRHRWYDLGIPLTAVAIDLDDDEEVA